MGRSFGIAVIASEAKQSRVKPQTLLWIATAAKGRLAMTVR
jgi:hypothetical protein